MANVDACPFSDNIPFAFDYSTSFLCNFVDFLHLQIT
jgi:hypothetical protein